MLIANKEDFIASGLNRYESNLLYIFLHPDAPSALDDPPEAHVIKESESGG